MNPGKTAFFILFVLLSVPIIGSAQISGNTQTELSIKARATGFHGKYGDNFVSIGYEPGLTIQSGNFWAGGVSFSENLLGGYTDINGKMTLLNFHIGAKRSLTPYFHPFMYALAGFRFAEYRHTTMSSDDDPLLNSFTLGYGIKSGLQIGKGRWRVEGSLELISGTKAKYITPDSYEKAIISGGSFRSHAERSNITGLSAGLGLIFILDWDDIVDE